MLCGLCFGKSEMTVWRRGAGRFDGLFHGRYGGLTPFCEESHVCANSAISIDSITPTIQSLLIFIGLSVHRWALYKSLACKQNFVCDIDTMIEACFSRLKLYRDALGTCAPPNNVRSNFDCCSIVV
jgi:hypothetical protein